MLVSILAIVFVLRISTNSDSFALKFYQNFEAQKYLFIKKTLSFCGNSDSFALKFYQNFEAQKYLFIKKL